MKRGKQITKEVDWVELERWSCDNPPDFSPDECERRMNEVIRRMARRPPTFDMETGQPIEGGQLSAEELKRRGYTA